MRLVAERTGLSPDVLRAWERRYGVVNPGRSEGGQRLYSDADLERLTLVVTAVQAGRSVGPTASLSLEELRRLVAEDAEQGTARPTLATDYLELAFAAVANLAPEELQAVLRSALLSLGAPSFLDDVVTPLLQQIGEAWHAGEVGIAHEHAASAVVRGVLAWLVDSLEVPENAPRAVVACLAGERHELGAALATAAATHAGWRVAYLGPDLPAAEIADAALRHETAVVGVSIITPENAASARAELQLLRGILRPGTALLAGGAGIPALGPLDHGITMIRDLTHWRALLRVYAGPTR
ncbi:MAG: MerR family transcriptional regulator [Gemmatimonadales bacterium]|nr:MerR family transcriptional regulator [Gemmatimonadales bacterium]